MKYTEELQTRLRMPTPLDNFVSQLVESQLLAMGEVRALMESAPAERRPKD